jgi:hypothetical protein
MRILGVIVLILGLASLVLGVMFIPQASSGQNEIVTSIAPLQASEVEGKYDAVSAKYNQVKAAEEPAIQGGTAGPSALYNYLSAQRALLGLAKANLATVKIVRTMGIVDIVIGVSLVLAGFVMFRKNSAA